MNGKMQREVEKTCKTTPTLTPAHLILVSGAQIAVVALPVARRCPRSADVSAGGAVGMVGAAILIRAAGVLAGLAVCARAIGRGCASRSLIFASFTSGPVVARRVADCILARSAGSADTVVCGGGRLRLAAARGTVSHTLARWSVWDGSVRRARHAIGALAVGRGGTAGAHVGARLTCLVSLADALRRRVGAAIKRHFFKLRAVAVGLGVAAGPQRQRHIVHVLCGGGRNCVEKFSLLVRRGDGKR